MGRQRTFMVRVRLLRDVHLPRFTFKKGQVWEKRSTGFNSMGFHAGGGLVRNEDFVVEAII